MEAADASAAGSCRVVDLGNGQYEVRCHAGGSSSCCGPAIWLGARCSPALAAGALVDCTHFHRRSRAGQWGLNSYWTPALQVFYRVPTPGKYLLKIACKELGAGGELVPIRGSPFTVHSVDPWQRRRLVGATPTRRLVSTGSSCASSASCRRARLACSLPAAALLTSWRRGPAWLPLLHHAPQGATLNSVGDELLLCGNEKSDGAVCHTLGNDNWMWGTGKRGEALPVFRKGHAAATSGVQLALFGGLSLEDGAPMNDLWYMRKVCGDSRGGL